jgi:DNA-binding MarR family transcriptional regulator
MYEKTPISTVIDKFWESVPFAWRQTRSKIRHIAIEKFKMTEEQFQVLRRIRKGSTSVSALAETSQTSASAVSKAVDILVRRGLIRRSQDPNDRRNIPLALTEEGLDVMANIYNETEKWLSFRFEQLSQEEKESLLGGLDNLQKAFTDQ